VEEKNAKFMRYDNFLFRDHKSPLTSHAENQQNQAKGRDMIGSEE
jgi:hypothetical protein